MNRHLSNQEIEYAAEKLAKNFLGDFTYFQINVYGVPRGGIPVAYAVAWALSTDKSRSNVTVVDDPAVAHLIVDDIVASGKTKERYTTQFPEATFLALADFLSVRRLPDQWLVFPWEKGESGHDESGHDIATRLLQFVGEDPTRGGLLETPKRMMKAWKDWTAGYHQDPAKILKVFEDGAEKTDQMIVVRDLPFFSHCEHHLAPFFGSATIAYIPDKSIVGLSKLSRVLDIFAKRLQVQERLTNQIADAIDSNLKPLGVGVMLTARHLCMESRGICKQGHCTTTSALRGEFLKATVRAEFLSIARPSLSL